jgi:hypothetical protein
VALGAAGWEDILAADREKVIGYSQLRTFSDGSGENPGGRLR